MCPGVAILRVNLAPECAWDASALDDDFAIHASRNPAVHLLPKEEFVFSEMKAR